MRRLAGQTCLIEVGGVLDDASSWGLVNALSGLRWVESSRLLVGDGADVGYGALGGLGRRSKRDTRDYKRWSGLEAFARADDGLRSVLLWSGDLLLSISSIGMRLRFTVQHDDDELGQPVVDVLAAMVRNLRAISSGAVWFGAHQAEPYTLWADSDFQGGSHAPPQPYLPGYSWGLVIPPLAAEQLPPLQSGPAELVRSVTAADGREHAIAVLTRRPCDVDDELLHRWRGFLRPALPAVRSRDAPTGIPTPMMLLAEDFHS